MLPVVWFDFIRDISLIRFAKKKPATVLVAGFTIRSLKPVVTTLGRQFIASTSFKTNSWSEAHCTERARRVVRKRLTDLA